jgi:hypothetical protein
MSSFAARLKARAVAHASHQSEEEYARPPKSLEELKTGGPEIELIGPTRKPRSKRVKTGPDADLSTNAGTGESTAGWFAQFGAVESSDDLDRILALPRRAAFDPTSEAAQELVRSYTARLRRPAGSMTLLPVQAFALAEAEATGGLLGLIRVGGGKTLLSLLAPVVLGARVAVLMVPPILRSKLFEIEYPHLSKHWRLPQLQGADCVTLGAPCVLHVVSYSALSTTKGADILERIKPDVVVLDEAHAVARNSARTKRWRRFLRAYPNTKVVALTGSGFVRSIKDGAPLAQAALRQQAPVPFDFHTLEAWSWALDPGSNRAEPGALKALMQPGDEDVRIGFQRRLVETPGVCATSDAPVLRFGETGSEAAVSLNIHAYDVDVPKEVEAALQELRQTAATPDGFEFDSMLEMSRYARQIASGFYYVRTWPRGEPIELRREWLRCRNAYSKCVRDYLAHSSRPGMDSPLLLARAAAAGQWDCPEYFDWAEIADKCEPDIEDVWLSDFLVEAAAKWGEKNVGIIWTRYRAFGAKLARLLGCPFYAGGHVAAAELDRDGMKGERTIVVSIDAHRRGHNLQAYNLQLVTSISSNGEVWEQKLGRLHRPGQNEASVDTYVCVHTKEMMNALCDAVESARFAQQLTGGDQKLLNSTFTFQLVKSKKGR